MLWMLLDKHKQKNTPCFIALSYCECMGKNNPWLQHDEKLGRLACRVNQHKLQRNQCICVIGINIEWIFSWLFASATIFLKDISKDKTIDISFRGRCLFEEGRNTLFVVNVVNSLCKHRSNRQLRNFAGGLCMIREREGSELTSFQQKTKSEL